MSSLFLSFLLTVIVINASPGPAMMFVLQQSQRYGIRAGFSAALGIEVGVFLYVILTALGIGAVFHLYPSLYGALQLVGAAYLLYLAVMAWPRKSASSHSDESGVSKNGAFLKGMLINVTNPKIVFFFLSVIPQFVPADAEAVTFIFYGIIFNIGGIIINFSVAALSDRVNALLRKAKWFDYVPPILFFVIAVIAVIGRLK
ncbi:LysE family translocator [Agrobacterium vitis]|uniref:LysE family translocator n=1 Tax=Agrobacterium vitis TaxID=373 RepID=UPI0008734888|nr:LysE family translocator [Agrobacterium vitis]MCE6076998.1 LysE family translocator [Agrobacterium vitis]MCM2449746.1 LysE family translocator [Agrobacterium vitis]MUO71681.1 LysE family translocator [Agrobacterium vitis]MUO86241.1 LysE family translocator [Agrobacterium vitis]